MKIQFSPYQNFNTLKPKNTPFLNYQYGLTQDTISFGAIKKSGLNSYQLLCANYFKAPLEKFKTQEEFKDWSEKGLKETLELNQYASLDESDTEERMTRLSTWKDFLLSNQKMKANPELALFVANSLTKDLYFDTKNFPPLFDEDVIKTTLKEFDGELKVNPKLNINFKKKYQENLKLSVLKSAEIIDDSTTEENSYWVRVPSESNDKENFQKNLKTLNVLSCEAWCTKGHFAQKYLKNGDFYIYMENNSPELSVRLEDSTIKEVRDRNHNGNFSLSYFDSLSSIIEDKGLEGYDSELQNLEYRKSQVDFAKNTMQDDINNKNYENILKSAGIKVSVREDGLLELSHFKKPHKDYTFQDLGINENEMFKHIGKINGIADFGDTQVTNLGNLESIDGYVFLGLSKLNDMGNVKTKKRVYTD